MSKELSKDVLKSLEDWFDSFEFCETPKEVEEEYPLFNNFSSEEQELLIERYKELIGKKMSQEMIYVASLYTGINSNPNFDPEDEFLTMKDYLDNQINPSDYGLSISTNRQKLLNEKVVSMLYNPT